MRTSTIKLEINNKSFIIGIIILTVVTLISTSGDR